MDTKVNYTLVGTFVISLITAIILAIIWLSSGFSFEQFTTYKIYMQESVSGLNIDSAVEYNGVNVGSVKSIDLNENNPQLVELLIDIKKTTPITRGTVATLATRGLTGLTFIALKDTSVDSRPLEKIEGQPYPIIQTAPSLFMRLDTALSQLSKNLQTVSKSIQSVLDPENQRMIKATLANLQQITGTFADNKEVMAAILQNTRIMSQETLPLLRDLQVQTLPATYRVLTNLDSTTQSLAELLGELKQNPAMLIKGVDRSNLLGPGEKR